MNASPTRLAPAASGWPHPVSYTHLISGNVSSGNDIAYAIMYSHRLVVHDNVARDSREQGLMLNYANQSRIIGNTVDGAGKCVFIYDANNNAFLDNHFANCEIGVHYTCLLYTSRCV